MPLPGTLLQYSHALSRDWCGVSGALSSLSARTIPDRPAPLTLAVGLHYRRRVRSAQRMTRAAKVAVSRPRRRRLTATVRASQEPAVSHRSPRQRQASRTRCIWTSHRTRRSRARFGISTQLRIKRSRLALTIKRRETASRSPTDTRPKSDRNLFHKWWPGAEGRRQKTRTSRRSEQHRSHKCTR